MLKKHASPREGSYLFFVRRRGPALRVLRKVNCPHLSAFPAIWEGGKLLSLPVMPVGNALRVLAAWYVALPPQLLYSVCRGGVAATACTDIMRVLTSLYVM